MRGEKASEFNAGEVEEEKARRVRLKLVNREQMVLRPMDVERLVSEDHEVRAIWEFVGCLDLSRYYEDIEVGGGGGSFGLGSTVAD